MLRFLRQNGKLRWKDDGRESKPLAPAMEARFTVFGQADHADPLDDCAAPYKNG